MNDDFDRQADRLLGDVFTANVEEAPVKEKKATSRKSAILMGISTGVIGLLGGAAAAAGGTAEAPSPSPTVTVSAPAREGVRETLTADKPAPQKAADGFGDGDHFVGKDVKPGTYRSPGAKEGLVDLCMASTLAKNGDVIDVKSGAADAPVIIEVTSSADVVSVAGCKAFSRVR